MLFLTPNQQCQCTEGRPISCLGLLNKKLSKGAWQHGILNTDKKYHQHIGLYVIHQQNTTMQTLETLRGILYDITPTRQDARAL